MKEEYTVEQHAVLIGLAGKCLEQELGDYGNDLFINSIIKYGNQRGNRMRNRAIRDQEPINYETFLAYGELKITTMPEDYSVQLESPVYINVCHRCQWYEAWKKYGLEKYGVFYCKYIDINLVQGFSSDMIMIAKTMIGMGDECCTFVNVGYEQTEEAKKRIASLKQKLNGKYAKDFLYHMGHYLNVFRIICKKAMPEKYDQIDNKLKEEFAAIYGNALKDQIWLASEQDFDLF